MQGTAHGFVPVLGYPMYFFAILGFWKVLGAIAILVPRFPRLKEWAYAGIFFDLTGAAASCAAVGGYGAYAFHVIAPLIIAVLTGGIVGAATPKPYHRRPLSCEKRHGMNARHECSNFKTTALTIACDESPDGRLLDGHKLQWTKYSKKHVQLSIPPVHWKEPARNGRCCQVSKGSEFHD